MTPTKTLAAVGSIVLGLASAAHAMDLTGTWTGSVKCVTHTSGAPDQKSEDVITAQFSQSGHEVQMTFNGNVFSSVQAAGRTVESAKDVNAGYVGLGDCGGSAVGAPNVYNFKAKTTPDSGAGKMKGTFTALVPDTVPSLFVCKVKLERTSTTDPAVSVACSVGIP